ncbi:hypothetical protein, partial [uncultured Lactobacillus sp.]|uniref:hypothetical protein n=1 Tax=uncultured Lactobacillus sp. TaxID=153152 RepID=UPI00260C3B91
MYGTYLWGIIFAWIGLATFLIIKGKPDNPNFSRLLGLIWLIAFFTIPFIVIKNYTKWIQGLINLGPIKRRIVKVQTAGVVQN